MTPTIVVRYYITLPYIQLGTGFTVSSAMADVPHFFPNSTRADKLVNL